MWLELENHHMHTTKSSGGNLECCSCCCLGSPQAHTSNVFCVLSLYHTLPHVPFLTPFFYISIFVFQFSKTDFFSYI
ncbi:hypothetical protein JHK82_017661 [Glycine max]|uniref:Uncharacterized protein n=2 Tax=Glycine subgen. Soja TaxID=1462606 RepID=A0A0R0J0I6_SOYBN|nr:hypothetical protein JHK87_017605 [Glycine soja]KAG5021763.1 hypothetical protein JHK85_018105 [Glycine max]KAG5036878.1 hypothetical protein JHK86_017718 [Glycine max]KAG5141966.1 hypothetical protein JHK82_017661 [Glycine max]KAH1085619.1 hypothetical protein GYH30_017533 [Glycine max]